jgi:hypothetical protein
MSCTTQEKAFLKAEGFTSAQISEMCGSGGSSSSASENQQDRRNSRTSRRSTRDRLIDSFDDLQRIIPDYEERPLEEILASDLFSGQNAYYFAPKFFKELQTYLLGVEQEFGVPPSQVPAGIPGSKSGTKGRGGGGGGGGGTAFANTEAGIRLDAELRRQEAERAHQRTVELERIRQENAMREKYLSEAGALIRNFADAQTRTRDLMAQLTGKDPISAAILSRGGVRRGGLTPAEAFQAQNQAFVDAPLPQLNPNASTEELRGTIESVRARTAPEAPPIGFAMGGMAGPHGISFGTQKRAVMLGEGMMNGDEEVGIIEPGLGITEVIPLAGGAAEGANLDPSTIGQALGQVYGDLGFSSAPKWTRGEYGFSVSPDTGGAQGLGRLGYRPRLVRDTGTGRTYYRDETGSLRHIQGMEPFRQAGFRWEDVLNVAPQELGAFGPVGSAFTGVGTDPVFQNTRRQFPVRAQPLVLPPEAGGFVLPDVRQLAGVWRFLAPSTRAVILDAYRNAGLGDQAQSTIEETIGFFTPRGTATRTGARFG